VRVVVAGRVVRHHIECRGTVQAVGFRPAVHRLAVSLGLAGWVRNGPQGASLEIEGDAAAVARFEQRLAQVLPPLAVLSALSTRSVPRRRERGFRILASLRGARRRALIPPDAALCPACRAEMEDPGDSRYRYPFANCTDCGPRYSLVRALPYDRERTAMACFALCPACRAEYEDPDTRRFHAEPVCCPACGPRLWLADARGAALGEGQAALAAARAALASGRILAVKGLGGFQLACNAEDAAVVKRLRERKRRPSKPFAVMVADLAAARRLVQLATGDAELLGGAQAPILLAPRRADCLLPDEIAPGLGDLGVLLPTTPLHVELFRDAPARALVMTSGNAGDEPICCGNREALRRLARIADLFLLHDRDVVRRVDDSVVRSDTSEPFLVRRSRGFVPRPLALPLAAPEPVLALGGHLQATACVAVGDEAFLSQHVGDLESEAARSFLVEVAGGLEQFLAVEARLIACDQHPDYPSHWIAEALARERRGRVLPLQHHLAHAAAVLAEHGVFPAEHERAAALLLDGTGWGDEAAAWGCEWLLLEGSLRWRRLAHAAPLPLVGGERAVREPWRLAAAALAGAGETRLFDALPLAALVAPRDFAQVAQLARASVWPGANGAGRIFEAAGALLGCAAENRFEGEAAARLEALAMRGGPAMAWPEVALPRDGAALPGGALLVAAARRAAAGEDLARVAAGLHLSFAQLAAELSVRCVPRDVQTLALGGGCLVNRLLRRALREALEARGLRVLLPRAVPPGDAGLAYGQAVLATAAAARGHIVQREGGV
jgi:hydrogenase maturation protein HypF